MSKFLDLLSGTVRTVQIEEKPKDIHPVKPHFHVEESLFTGDSERDYAIITGDRVYSVEAVIEFIKHKSGLDDWGITPGWFGYGGCCRRADGKYEWKVDRKEYE